MRTSLALLPLLVIACDSPGGGGGGQVNCAVTPNVPICNPDVSDTVSPDTTAPDTTGPSDPETTQPDTTQPDTTQPDTTQPDTTQPDTTQPDTTQPDTTQPPECTGSSTRCSGAEAQVCSGGFWVTTQVCSGNTTCQNGSCVPTSVCTNGTRRCTGNTLEQCMNGQWAFAENCTNGCSNNACTAPPTGNLNCSDVFDCVVEAGCFDNLPTPPTSACTSQCTNQGSTTGRNEMNALLSCYSSCSYDDECILHTCTPLRAACFFDTTGGLSCAQIDECIGGCTSGGACVVGCYEQGTSTAQGQYLYVSECLDGYCGQDQTCWGQAISSGQPCEQAFNTCFP